jgi:hypothetical protein
MGLVLPMSGCPRTAFFCPMARVPRATMEEGAHRVASMYMLGQWMRQDEGAEANLDFEGLEHLYDRVRVVNQQLHKRLQNYTRPLFAAYLAEDETP